MGDKNSTLNQISSSNSWIFREKDPRKYSEHLALCFHLCWHRALKRSGWQWVTSLKISSSLLHSLFLHCHGYYNSAPMTGRILTVFLYLLSANGLELSREWEQNANIEGGKLNWKYFFSLAHLQRKLKTLVFNCAAHKNGRTP